MRLREPRLWLLLENVRSLHNVGALFRTADAAGVAQILLTGLTPLPNRLEAAKTALGTVGSTPWQYFANPLDAVGFAHANGLQSVALEQSPNSVNLYQTATPPHTVLVVGHERAGVSENILAAVGQSVFIPMVGKSAHSLNVSTAAGIALYELRRRAWYS